MAGYKYAKGKCVVNISADLQDPPDLINAMLEYLYRERYDIVICNRESREETLFRRMTSRIFYAIIKKISFPRMPLGGFDYVLLSERVKDIILDNQEANAFFQGQILWTGLKVKFIPYKRRDRDIRGSKWTMSKKVKYLIDGIMSYSYFPLRLMSVIGGVVAFLGFLYAVVIFFAKIFNNIPVQGWAPLMIVILVLSGFQMLMLGVIGEYVWRTLAQVRGRKQYLIEEIYE
jgi:dolichol-phosphate mannosyltransferase